MPEQVFVCGLCVLINELEKHGELEESDLQIVGMHLVLSHGFEP